MLTPYATKVFAYVVLFFLLGLRRFFLSVMGTKAGGARVKVRYVLEACLSHAAECFGFLRNIFFGPGQRASYEKFAYANLTNRLTPGLRGIRVVVGHPTLANMAFERLSPQPFSASSVSQPKTIYIVIYTNIQ